MVDVAIPADRNVMPKVAEKKIMAEFMLNMKCIINPVIIGATGIVTKVLKINLEAIPRKHSIDSLLKTAILGTSHIIRKMPQSGT